ncbi:MAG: 3-phosphoshikimate 1-carboxyvinyltransferase [Eubacteriales bacterium]|nr:3-phosphoshikimate 1-carboxyvinyltransferase [Eubacteriales bacterium]
MDTTIKSGARLSGTVTPPPSKSAGHRAIIGAALAGGTSTITNIGYSEDIEATIEAMRSLGAKITKDGTTLVINGEDIFKNAEDIIIDCRESGSTLRFLVPLGIRCKNVTYIGSERLGQRPLDAYYRLFDEWGIEYTNDNGKLPLTMTGGTAKSDIFIEGNVSSQYITGLLYSLPLCDGEYTIHITSPMESKGYIDLTIQMLKRFGIEIINNNYQSFYIKGNQKYTPCDYICEGDFSQAAFFLVAGAIGNDISCNGLDMQSMQGDKEIVNIIRMAGGKIEYKDGLLKAYPSDTCGVTIDASQIPDLVPIISLLGVFSKGDTRIINGSRLRIKESDRLNTTASQLNALGADIEELEDGLIIHGTGALRGGIADSCNDHRIAMTLGMAATKTTGDVEIKDSGSVKKSYPHFWEDYKKLGGKIL